MKLHHVIIESIHALRSSMLRSVLTVVGIVVGIFSVAGMLALGEGLSNNVMARFDSFSQGDISIQGSLTRKDFVWVRELPSVKSATATTTLPSAQVVIGSEEFNPTVQTVVGDFSKLQSFTVTEGEVYDFDDSSLSESVAIVTDKFDTEVRQKTGGACSR
jgi:putative ABC transport system permease protein